MKKKEYTHEDLEKEFLKTPARREAYKKGVERLHTKQQVISRLEQDKYKPSYSTLEKIAHVFGKRIEINFV